MSARPQIVDEIRSAPHWRVEIRPTRYRDDLIADLGQAVRLLERTQVRLRGWSYPHLSRDETKRSLTSHSLRAWEDFAEHLEYLEFFQSGQFVHLFAIRERRREAWSQQLRVQYEGMLVRDGAPEPHGFIDIGNFVWTMTEVFEFTARLCEAGLYGDAVSVSVGLRSIEGFALTTGPERAWYGHYVATSEQLERARSWTPSDLIVRRSEIAIDESVWFFQRFGWLEPNIRALREQQAELLQRALRG